MSECQYYEFRAIDAPLTEEQKEKVSSLSSRAEVTSRQATFVYHYGDFRGDEKQLLKDHFDIMLYMSSWGGRRLMFRIPTVFIDMREITPFCVSEEIDLSFSDNKKEIILDLYFHDEEGGGWIEGEGWLDELTDLREELIQGDFRILYLAWLKAAENALEMEEIDEETLEPPVPSGLKQLSKAQKVYAEYLELDEAMIVVASQQSSNLQEKEIDMEKWIDKLSEQEKHDFLVCLSRKEKNLSTRFNKRLQELAAKEQPEKKRNAPKRRTVATLIKLAEEWHQKKKEEEIQKAELTQKKKLESLAARKTQIWNEIYSLIEEKNTKSYDKAIVFLNDLRELAEFQGDLPAFREQTEKIRKTYSRLSGLLRRMRSSKLIE